MFLGKRAIIRASHRLKRGVGECPGAEIARFPGPELVREFGD
jgi:hypothetical protein